MPYPAPKGPPLPTPRPPIRATLTLLALLTLHPLPALTASSTTTTAATTTTAPAAPPLHWSFLPVRRPPLPLPPPSPSPSPSAPTPPNPWPRSPIDAFILAQLTQHQLQPAPETDRPTWLRRLHFDLTGLPPTPEEIDAFVADPSPDAYRTRVEVCLASPRYGERWAQHWLDLVRYADTHGFEVNTERPHAWTYRDYVIRAFNHDTAYDRFVREQIIGDQLGQHAATGFLITASVLLPGQIGADDVSKRLARQDALDEIVVNISQTFLGLSIGCARCHDHKSDPISSRDYYSLQAFVAGVEYEDREIPTPESSTAPHSPPTPQLAFAGKFRTPDRTRVLGRGDPENPKEDAPPAIPRALGSLSLSTNTPEAERRRALAHWITDPNHPLTARVMVNRVWQGHFGTGLVDTPSDFGHGGSPPSHPELLDWLASEFVRSGWSLKHLHRLIVLSATYRQSTQPAHPEASRTRDANHRWLSSFPRRRLESEPIRDAMLAVAGNLNLATEGPGFNLFDRRGGLTGFNPVESYRNDGLRRMIYAHKVRREREAVFGAFDCPDAGQSTARRRTSTTPLQALNLFNSRFTLEQSEVMAQRVIADVGLAPNDQVRRAYRLALGREPDTHELSTAAAAVANHGLPVLCRALFNANEFLFVP